MSEIYFTYLFSHFFGLSSSKKSWFYLLQWKPFKNDEKSFFFQVKSSIVLFLRWLFCPDSCGLAGKRLDKKGKVNLKIYDVTDWETNNYNIHVAPWCSGYHYCTTSFTKAWTQVLRRLKSCSQHVGDSRRWGSLTMVPAGNKTKRLSSVNHTTKAINHHHHHHHHYHHHRILT